MPRLVVPAYGLDLTYAPAPPEPFFEPAERVALDALLEHDLIGDTDLFQALGLREPS